MALLPLCTTTIPIPTSNTTTCLNNRSFSPKTSQLSPQQRSLNPPNKSKSHAVSCKGGAENDETQYNSPVVDRRNMLIGLGGLYGAASTAIGGGVPASLAAPVHPDVEKCYLTSNPDRAGTMDEWCCLNFKTSAIKDFKPNHTQVKERLAAHTIDEKSEYLQDFKQAICEMRKLDRTDPFHPHSLHMQSRIHGAYCDAVYRQLGDSNHKFMVHSSWLFYPFHRWELYFFERIAGKLIGKPDFRLPFWAWDFPDQMTMPPIYMDNKSSLYDSSRAVRKPPTDADPNDKNQVIADLGFGGQEDPKTKQKFIDDNLEKMHEQMVVQGGLSTTFLGQRYVACNTDTTGGGSIENGAHAALHPWVGGNMAKFRTAARDPIFFAHHANVDRMWHIWDTKIRDQEKSSGYEDNSDFLDATFIFYDANCQPVRVRVGDCLDTRKLGYTYPEKYVTLSELPWYNVNNQGSGTGTKDEDGKTSEGASNQSSDTKDKQAVPLSQVGFPLPLNSVVRKEVKRPPRNKSISWKSQEVVEVDMKLSHTNDPIIVFDVYVNDDYAHYTKETTLFTPNYAGSFSTLPMDHHHDGDSMNTTRFTLALNNLIQQIGADNDDTLEVTLVPRAGQDAIVITDLKLNTLEDN